MPRTVYTMQVWHEGLGKYREIRGYDASVVQQKADAQTRQWEDMWARRQELEFRKDQKEKAAQEKEAKKELAEVRTRAAQDAISALQTILQTGIAKSSVFDWESLMNTGEYPEPHPKSPNTLSLPFEPRQTDTKYKPNLSFINRVFGFGAQKKIEAAGELFRKDREAWEQEKNRVTELNEDEMRDYNVSSAKWEKCRLLWLEEQKNRNQEITNRKQKYIQVDVDGLLDYCDLVLSTSEYPDWFPQQFDTDYIPGAKMLIVEYILPSVSQLPSLAEVRYAQARDEFKEYVLSESRLAKIYDDLVYQTTLRTVLELFQSDSIKAIDSIVINGHVRRIDKATGKPTQICILSVHVARGEFLEINLRDVDPKACFKRLKGIGSSKLHGMAAVAPIQRISREDSRFVEAYDVAHTLDDSVNIAAMDWLDFEHLIREIFEKEFSAVGGEVKITRASRDHGVDGIAFDPDPIRGGKIVIQAKRYTSVVDVAAVRDLYGTVVNEGAIKGILVTTSDYGPDAYTFAKDKPLSLLNGSNLLHMLQRHGYRAKIDLPEAKKILSQ